MKESTRWGSSIACILKNLWYIRAIQGHTGGNLMALVLMGHVAIPYKWKEFLFHRGGSYDVTSILKSGLIAGGRESKEGGQTIFFTLLNPSGYNPHEEGPCDDPSKPRKVQYQSKWQNSQDAVYCVNLARAHEEAPSDDLSIPRKVHYHSTRKRAEDAVYWIKLSRAQDKGPQFWPTRSHAAIVHSSVPADCIYKVISQKETNFTWKTLDASSAAATAARLWKWSYPHQETGAECKKWGERIRAIQQRIQVKKEVILVGERKWNNIPAYKSFKGDSVQGEISKLVMRLVRSSFEFYGSKIAESMSVVRRAKILGHGLASTPLWRKQQDEVPVLHAFSKIFIEYSCDVRTHLWESDSASVDGSRRYSVQLGKFCIP